MSMHVSITTAGYSLLTAGSGCGHAGPDVQPTAIRLASGAVGARHGRRATRRPVTAAQQWWLGSARCSVGRPGHGVARHGRMR